MASTKYETLAEQYLDEAKKPLAEWLELHATKLLEENKGEGVIVVNRRVGFDEDWAYGQISIELTHATELL